jgi:hypothetical protein
MGYQGEIFCQLSWGSSAIDSCGWCMGGCFFYCTRSLTKVFDWPSQAWKSPNIYYLTLLMVCFQSHIRMSEDVCNGGCSDSPSICHSTYHMSFDICNGSCSDSTSVCQKTYAMVVAVIPHPYVRRRVQWLLLWFHIHMSLDVCNGGCSDSTSVCQ